MQFALHHHCRPPTPDSYYENYNMWITQDMLVNPFTLTSFTETIACVKCQWNAYYRTKWYLGLYLVTVMDDPLSDILWNTLPILRKYSSVGSISQGRDITSELIMPGAVETELLPGVCACFFELCSDKTINWKPWEGE